MREVRIAQGVTVSIASGPSTESGRRTLIVVVHSEDGQLRTEMVEAMKDVVSQTDHVFNPAQIGQQIEIDTDLREDSAVHALVETIFRVIIDWRQTLTDSQRNDTAR
jgi:hypothetical protein